MKNKEGNIFNTIIMSGVLATFLASTVSVFLSYKSYEQQKKIESFRVSLSMLENKMNVLVEARKKLFYNIDWVKYMNLYREGNDEAYGLISDLFKRQAEQKKFIEENIYLFSEKDVTELTKIDSTVCYGALALSDKALKKSGISNKQSDDEIAIADKVHKAIDAAWEYSDKLKSIIDNEIKRTSKILFNN